MSRYTTELRFIIQNTSREEVESWFTDYELEDYLTSDEIEVIEEERICQSKPMPAYSIQFNGRLDFLFLAVSVVV